MSEAALDALLRRDRVIVGAALAALIVAAWLYLLHLASAMSDMAMPDMLMMPGMAMPASHALELGRGRGALRHVGRDDDRHDDARRLRR